MQITTNRTRLAHNSSSSPTQAQANKNHSSALLLGGIMYENHNSSSQANKYHSSAHLLCGIIERELQHKLTSKQESQLCPLAMWDNIRELQLKLTYTSADKQESSQGRRPKLQRHNPNPIPDGRVQPVNWLKVLLHQKKKLITANNQQAGCPWNLIHNDNRSWIGVVMILPQVHLRKPCYDFTFL